MSKYGFAVCGAAVCLLVGGTVASAGPGGLLAKPPPPKKGKPHAAPVKSLPPPLLPKCTLHGTAGADFLHGTKRSDVICGLGGADHIWAGPNDIVIAGPGNDAIYSRNDRPNMILGGPGRDRARVDPGLDFRFRVERLLP